VPHPPRPPSIDHGVISFLWAFGLAVFIWAGLLAVGISQPTAVIVGAVAGFLIFVYVRIYGEEEPRRPRRAGSAPAPRRCAPPVCDGPAGGRRDAPEGAPSRVSPRLRGRHSCWCRYRGGPIRRRSLSRGEPRQSANPRDRSEPRRSPARGPLRRRPDRPGVLQSASASRGRPPAEEPRAEPRERTRDREPRPDRRRGR
jgi:hypothetical protein